MVIFCASALLKDEISITNNMAERLNMLLRYLQHIPERLAWGAEARCFWSCLLLS